MQVDTITTPSSVNPKLLVSLPEKDAFVGYLTLLHLHDQKDYAKGLTLAKTLLTAIQLANRRTMDTIAAKIYFYYARFSELQSVAATIRP